MVEISEYAYRKLFKTLDDNINVSTEYGSPPIFYWYRKMLQESYRIEECRYLRRGVYKYQLGNSLGIAHVQCDYVGRKRFLIIIDYEINTTVLFSWKGNTQKGGLIPKPKLPKHALLRKPFHQLTTKPLFGYSFVMNDRKQYNLIDNNGNLLTQWFTHIKPLQQPFGKYQIIAYINVGGQFCALGYDGKVYSLGKTWKEMHTENRNFLNSELFMNIITEQIYNTMNTNKKTVRLTESKLRNMIAESIKKVVKESSNSSNRSSELVKIYEELNDILGPFFNEMNDNDMDVISIGYDVMAELDYLTTRLGRAIGYWG